MSPKIIVIGILLLLITTTIPITIADDITPPVTNLTTDPPEPSNGWYAPGVILTLNATDNESGVNTTYYQINNQTWEIYTHPITFNLSGINNFSYYSIDNDNNTEIPHNITLKIDDIPPTINLSLDPPEPNGNNGWYITPPQLVVNLTDKESGLHPYQTTYYNYTTSNYTTIIAQDCVGNTATQEPPHINIDTTPPIIELTWEYDSSSNQVLWIATCDDTDSGMDYVEFYENGNLKHTDHTAPYTWSTSPTPTKWDVIGFKTFTRIDDNYITILALCVLIREHSNLERAMAIAYDKAGNTAEDWMNPATDFTSPTFVILKPLILPKNFTGTFNPIFINAQYTEWYY